jgi:hypothetical protein
MNIKINKPVAMTIFFLTSILLYKFIEKSTYSFQGFFINVFTNIPEFLYNYLYQFKLVIVVYIIGNLLLFILGRNMYKWGKHSNAESYIKNSFFIIGCSRKIIIPLSILIIISQFYFIGTEHEKTTYQLLEVGKWYMISLESYWIFFKFNIANKAINICNGTIDYFKRVCKQKDQFCIKSSWNTIFNESGNYYYFIDYSNEKDDWELIETKTKCKHK